MTLTTVIWVLGAIAIITFAVGCKIGAILTDDTEEIDLTEDYQIIDNLKKQERELIERIDHLENKAYAKQYGVFEVKHYRDALDVYERAGIKIPLDIIEELSFIDPLKTKEEAINYIENQRANWKLENSKKVGKMTWITENL